VEILWIVAGFLTGWVLVRFYKFNHPVKKKQDDDLLRRTYMRGFEEGYHKGFENAEKAQHDRITETIKIQKKARLN